MTHVLIAEEDARRLDAWLHARFPERSRSSLQKLIVEGHVLLNGRPSVARAHVRAGDRIELRFPPPKPARLVPEARPLEVLVEDADLLVVNKPPGVVVHPGAGHATGTLVHALLHHCRGQLSGIGGEERPGIVHRLDKDTSGCLLVAKTDAAHRALAAALKARALEKIYLVLVHGVPQTSSGRIAAPIGRHAVHRKRMAVSKKGREAITDWKLLICGQGIGLLECRIHTGRTHQIRVHLAALGHPVVGDLLYGGARERSRKVAAQRQMLHAWQLGLRHPTTDQEIRVTAPIPEDFRAVARAADLQI
ncbi:MAG: RluA family pseudouridine synthase [Verrucomicrobiae bacterium]|nr:RluA family pseudouridine synthase [Verrucomicrobiae bacterium]